MADLSPCSWLKPALHCLIAASVTFCAVQLAACSSLRQALPANKEAQQHAADLQELQLKVMRFADEYVGRVFEPIQQFQASASTPEERLTAQTWRLSQSTSAYTIASGPNPVTNALDMVVLATLSRMVMDDSWVSEKYGERAAPLREAHKSLEPQAWSLLDGILSAPQLEQLHDLIDEWRAEHPKVRAVAYVHFRDFARSIGRPRPGEQRSSDNLFAMLGLDPLSNLDPAVQEIAQTRQLAERTIYYLQRAPNLLDMQIERLSYQLAAMPETEQLLHNADTLSAATKSIGVLASDLPDVISGEREAAISQFMAALNAEQAQMRALAGELKNTLEAGTATSESLTTTIQTLDAFVSRFDKPIGAAPQTTDTRPFDIRDYTATARELATAAQQLQALLIQLNSSGAAVSGLTRTAADDLRLVVDHAFWRAVQLTLILTIAIAAAVLVVRHFSRRDAH